MAKSPENSLSGSYGSGGMNISDLASLYGMMGGGAKSDAPSVEYIDASDEEMQEYASVRSPADIKKQLLESKNQAATLTELSLSPLEQKLMVSSLNLSALFNLTNECNALGFQTPTNADKFTPTVKKMRKILEQEIQERKDYAIFQTASVYGEASRLKGDVGEWKEIGCIPNFDPATQELDGFEVVYHKVIGVNNATGAEQIVQVPEKYVSDDIKERFKEDASMIQAQYNAQMAQMTPTEPGCAGDGSCGECAEKEPVKPMKDSGKGRGGDLSDLVNSGPS